MEKGLYSGPKTVAPKLSNLHNKKPLHLIDEFKNMLLNNIKILVIAACILFIWALLEGVAITGCIFLITLLYIAYSSYNGLKDLEKLDAGQNSYTFLRSFRDWIHQSIERYGKLYRIVYPLLIITFYLAVWCSDSFSDIRQEISADSKMFLGLNISATIFVLIIASLTSIFSKALHRKDVNLIYSGIINKLNASIADMEELNA